MINQQLTDYIQEQVGLGISKEQITNALIAKGWKENDITESFNSITPATSSVESSNPLTKLPFKQWQILTGIALVVVAVGITIFLLINVIAKPKEAPKQKNNEVTKQIPTVTLKPKTVITPADPQAKEWEAMQKSSIALADNLVSCTPYKAKFTHPLTGDTLEKEILGIVAGRCIYQEQMPNNGKLRCGYTESERKAVAQYYKDLAAADSFGTDVSFGTFDEEGQQKEQKKVTYTINGKEVANPLQEAMDTGICVISGY